MAAEFNRIPVAPGSKVQIFDRNGALVAEGALIEDLSVGVSSTFGQLFDTGGSDAFAVLGGALKSLSGGALGFSGSWKQMGYSHWTGTSPIQLSFTLEFHYSYNALEEIVTPINRLTRLVLPGEGIGGNLIPLGPSILEATAGTTESNRPPGSESGGASVAGADSYVNISVLGHTFMGMLISEAKPTLSKFCDESNHPIWGKVEITALSIHTAIKGDFPI